MAKVKVTVAANKERAREVLARLRKAYPEARCTLDYENPLQLLVATILAAQCTDERVNIVTKDLFRKYRSAADYVEAPEGELETDIKSCGFYRNKAKSIRKACANLLERFAGQVPGSMDELLSLDGVGRKTANVILGECFDTPGIIVDTHCGRVSRRLGFTRNEDPVKVERDLMKAVPEPHWTVFSHYLVFHGRETCASRAPRCSTCVLAGLCPFPDTREGKRVAK